MIGCGWRETLWRLGVGWVISSKYDEQKEALIKCCLSTVLSLHFQDHIYNVDNRPNPELFGALIYDFKTNLRTYLQLVHRALKSHY